jgi:HlyD family secretion protein
MAQLATAASDAGNAPATPQKSRFKKLRLLIPLILLIVAGGLGLRYWLTRPDDNEISLSGRIEGYEIDLGPKVGGLVSTVTVREGDTVQQDQVIAQLDDKELQAQLAAAKASYGAAQQQVTQAQLQLDVINSQIREAQLNLQQAQGDASGRVNQAEATVATAQAQLAEAQAQLQQANSSLNLAQKERDRFATLVAEGAVSQQQFDQVQTQFETAQKTLQARQAAVTAAERQVNATQGALTQAQTTELNPEIRTAQVTRLQKQQEQAAAQLAAAQAEVKRAAAQQEEIAARIADLTVTSPINGIVVTRTVEPGEVIAAGTTILSVIDLSDVYLRGYIPEGRLGEVRVGQPAHVFLDSAPNQPLDATVDAIDTEASFTPENIYFQSDRVTQVFGLKLGIENPNGYAKPGMPADGEIILGSEE